MHLHRSSSPSSSPLSSALFATSLLCALALMPILLMGLVAADELSSFEWSTPNVRLPKPLSDHTATLSSKNGLVYVAGGCDSPNGNEFGGDFFFCATLSQSLYSFDPETLSFEDLGSMPQARYRHAAEIIGDELWLIGGRDVADNLLEDIDIYNIETKQWRSMNLPPTFQTSDHASFTENSSSSPFIYIAGGYNQTYTALAVVFRIDTAATTDGSPATPLIEVMAPMLEARGDIYGASNGAMAFVGGGFTDTNGFCSPLPSVESYSFSTNTWSSEPNLINERGEVVLVELDDKLYALGGERQIENICNITGDTDPGELTVGLEVVEVLDDSEWKILDEFPSHKFRFAAVAISQTGAIYTFGGQTDYDDDCECFKATDEIQTFGTDGNMPSGSFATSGPWNGLSLLSGILCLVSGVFVSTFIA